MAKVKVWNDNKYPHTERYKGKEITIPAGEYIEMDYFDAVDFQGQFTPVRYLGTGAHDPACFKMIRVERPVGPVLPEEKNVFHATGKAFGSPAEMIAFAKAYAAANPEQIAEENTEADSGKVSMSKEQYENLLSRLAAVESERTEKKGPGRPRKEAAG